MWLSLVAGAVAVGLGCLLAFAPGTSARGLGPFHSFALLTSVAVVLGQLLPEALAVLGLPAALVCAGAFLLPRAAEWLRRRLAGESGHEHGAGPCSDLGLELGYAGFLLHRVGDGVALALFAGPIHADHGHYDVLGAIAMHTIPVTAMVVTAFRVRYGRRSALLRSTFIVMSTFVGVALPFALAPGLLQAVAPWLTAAVGGLLLHVVSHGWAPAGPPSLLGRLMDLLALLAALLLLLLGGGDHHHHGAASMAQLPPFRDTLVEALWNLGLQTAPMLLLGLLAAAVIQTLSAHHSPAGTQQRQDGTLAQALRGAFWGLPFPVCACGALRVADLLRRRGVLPVFVLAFLLATPEWGIDTFALSGHFLGWDFAVLRLLSAVVLAGGVALSVAPRTDSAATVPSGVVRERAPEQVPGGSTGQVSRGNAFNALAQVLQHFEELLYHVGAWTIVGLLIAAYLQAVLGPGVLRAVSWPFVDVAAVTLIAFPSYVCASSAIPIAAVLAGKGLSPGAVLVGLLLGPAVNLGTLGFLRLRYGNGMMLRFVGVVVAGAWLWAAIANRLLADVWAVRPPVVLQPDGYGWLSYLSGIALLLLVLRAVWRDGLRTWLSSLGQVLVQEPDSPAPPRA